MPPQAPSPSCEHAPSVGARVLITLVRFYQLVLSWLLGGHCRFTPSCSHYAIAAFRNVGAWRGALYTIGRLSRCHPFHARGFDPPPPARPAAQRALAARGEQATPITAATDRLPSRP